MGRNEHELHESNENRENTDEMMVRRTCIMLLIQKAVSKLSPFS